jgi:hypothetical protein
MHRNIVKFTLCLALLGCAATSFAQKDQSAPVADTDSCAFSFSSGSGNTLLSFCVSTNGNISAIEVPSGQSQVAFGAREGYGVCDQDPDVAYFDYSIDGNSGNWLSATVLLKTAKSVKLARNTSDGIWTLTQTISLVPSTPEIKVVMALKNNTTTSRTAYLVRYADVDAGNEALDDLSATSNSAAAWVASVPFAGNFGTGLQLENVGNSQFGFVTGYARNTFHAPTPCNFAADSSGTPLVNTDGSILLVAADAIGPKKTKTTTMIYKAF